MIAVYYHEARNYTGGALVVVEVEDDDFQEFLDLIDGRKDLPFPREVVFIENDKEVNRWKLP